MFYQVEKSAKANNNKNNNNKNKKTSMMKPNVNFCKE
jgi:hypothetical protein